MSITVNGESKVPPGFRFHPTEEELLQYYLRKKLSSEQIDLDVIQDVDLNKLEPWDIQEKCKIGSTPQNDWYFFSHKDKKYPTGKRTNRATISGFWKATGRDKVIYSNSNKIGMRKTLVFYKGRAPHGLKSDWIMHEYRLIHNNDDIRPRRFNSQTSSSYMMISNAMGEATSSEEESWVVCRVFKKKNFCKSLDEEEEEEDASNVVISSTNTRTTAILTTPEEEEQAKITEMLMNPGTEFVSFEQTLALQSYNNEMQDQENIPFPLPIPLIDNISNKCMQLPSLESPNFTSCDNGQLICASNSNFNQSIQFLPMMMNQEDLACSSNVVCSNLMSDLDRQFLASHNLIGGGGTLESQIDQNYSNNHLMASFPIVTSDHDVQIFHQQQQQLGSLSSLTQTQRPNYNSHHQDNYTSEFDLWSIDPSL